MLLISYFDWADLSTASPHISAYLYTFLSSARKCRPPPHLPVSRQGNAPLIMGTCPPNSSRHLTSKQTFVGCRVIGAPASRCKLDTSLVGTNIGSPGGILKCPSTHYNSVKHALTRFLSQQAGAVSRPRVRDLLEE